MRLAIAQLNPKVGDFTGNTAQIRTAYGRGCDEGVELVITPELAVCGYPPQDLLDKESFVQRSAAEVQALAEITAGEAKPALLVGAVLPADAEAGKRVRNVAALLANGQVQFVQIKKLLPFYDVFDEQRYFEPAAEQSLTMIGAKPLAITICEDAWNDKLFWSQRRYGDDPVEDLMAQWSTLPPHISGERLIVNLSASPFWHGKPELRRQMLASLAKRHRAAVVLVNQVGANDSLIFDGSSFAVNAGGEVLAEAAAFREDFVVVDTAAESSRLAATLPTAARQSSRSAADRSIDIEETWNALVLGTRDYVRKTGFRKVLIGLSGGIDSALVAAIAAEALGAENVRGLGMPSEFSSEGSVSDSEQLAQNLGIRFDTLPIRSVYDGFHGVLEGEFAGTPFGLAEENLQPRIRGTLLMAMSNKTGALVLTTGNKSEMAVGYCTLYGDHGGGAGGDRGCVEDRGV